MSRCERRLICEVDPSLNTLIKQPFIHYGSPCCLFCVWGRFTAWDEFMIVMRLYHKNLLRGFFLAVA